MANSTPKPASGISTVNAFLNLSTAYTYLLSAEFALRESSTDFETVQKLNDAMKIVHSIIG